jgi:hypothetical protein
MPRPRLPVSVANITGAAIKNPKRHSCRANPKVGELGAAPKVLSTDEVAAWNEFRDEMPWLGKSDRTIVLVASRLRARVLSDPEAPMNLVAQLRMCMSAMGGTPADRTRVTVPDQPEDNPASEFFN